MIICPQGTVTMITWLPLQQMYKKEIASSSETPFFVRRYFCCFIFPFNIHSVLTELKMLFSSLKLFSQKILSSGPVARSLMASENLEQITFIGLIYHIIYHHIAHHISSCYNLIIFLWSSWYIWPALWCEERDERENGSDLNFNLDVNVLLGSSVLTTLQDTQGGEGVCSHNDVG